MRHRRDMHQLLAMPCRPYLAAGTEAAIAAAVPVRIRAALNWLGTGRGQARRPARSLSQPADRGGEMHQHSRPGWDADQAVAVLYGAHHRALAQMATLLVNDVVAADEIVEAAFAAMHAAWWRLRNSDKALSYLRRAVVRRARSYRVARSDPSSRQPGPPRTGQPDMTPSHALLVTALHALPPRQREALVLRHYAGLPDTQIAFVMGIPARSASKHVERGTACLRAALERHHAAAAHQPSEHPIIARIPPSSI